MSQSCMQKHAWLRLNTRAANHNKCSGNRRLPSIPGVHAKLLFPLTVRAQRRHGGRRKAWWKMESRSYHFVVPPSSVKVHRAVPATLEHRPAAASGLHITKYLRMKKSKIKQVARETKRFPRTMGTRNYRPPLIPRFHLRESGEWGTIRARPKDVHFSEHTANELWRIVWV